MSLDELVVAVLPTPIEPANDYGLLSGANTDSAMFKAAITTGRTVQRQRYRAIKPIVGEILDIRLQTQDIHVSSVLVNAEDGALDVVPFGIAVSLRRLRHREHRIHLDVQRSPDG